MEAFAHEARLYDGRPDTSAPLASLFPGFIAGTSIPKDLPRNVDNKMSDVFRYKGMTATQVYEQVHDSLKGIMTLQPDERAKERNNEVLKTRFLVATSVPWLVASKAKQRDHWPYAGAALLESLIVPDYRPTELEGPLGHIRNDVYEILLDNVIMQIIRRSHGRSTEMQEYSFPDGLSPPDELPPLEPHLQGDIEGRYNERMAELRLRANCENLSKYVAGLPAAQVIVTDEDGNEKVCISQEVAAAVEQVHQVRFFLSTFDYAHSVSQAMQINQARVTYRIKAKDDQAVFYRNSVVPFEKLKWPPIAEYDFYTSHGDPPLKPASTSKDSPSASTAPGDDESSTPVVKSDDPAVSDGQIVVDTPESAFAPATPPSVVPPALVTPLADALLTPPLAPPPLVPGSPSVSTDVVPEILVKAPTSPLRPHAPPSFTSIDATATEDVDMVDSGPTSSVDDLPGAMSNLTTQCKVFISFVCSASHFLPCPASSAMEDSLAALPVINGSCLFHISLRLC